MSMATQQKIFATRSTTAPPAAQAIRLDIAGPNLLLSGSFEQWVPLVMEGLREDRSVQLLVDVTSSSPNQFSAANSNGILFSFDATSIKRAKEGGHKIKGLMTHGAYQAEADVFLQAPAAHSPFAVLSFDLPNESFEGLWQEFGKRAAARAAAGGTEVRAQGWLRPPTVAAA
jgi:hypothetical protein